MRRQPIKKHQRGVSLFVLQWLVLRALRYVQCDLSSLGYTKVYSHLDSLIRRDWYADLPSLNNSPIALKLELE